MENPIKMDDLGEKTLFFRKHPYGTRLISWLVNRGPHGAGTPHEK